MLSEIARAIFTAVGGELAFKSEVGNRLRAAIDEVIDARRTGRFSIAELEKTEKTYIGTKIEIVLRSWLGFKKGKKLDLLIDGHEVDVKNTISKNWTIPPEAVGHVCILVRCDEAAARVWVGLILIRAERLNPGKNRDGKSSICASALKDDTYWIIEDKAYPPALWTGELSNFRERVMKHAGGSDRLAELFRVLQRRPISRVMVEAIAQQDDYMKRIRRNGGARDILAREGIAILWGQKDKSLISSLGLGKIGADEFISVQPTSELHIQMLKDAGHID